MMSRELKSARRSKQDVSQNVIRTKEDVNYSRRDVARRPNDFQKEIRAMGTLDVPKEWKVGTQTRYVYPQQCFVRSYEYATHRARRNAGAWLVHGESICGLGPHAWVELPDGLVFDAVYQRWYRNYYGKGEDGQRAEAWYKYDGYAASMIHWRMNTEPTDHQIFRYDHWLKLPWGDPNNPLLFDSFKASELMDARDLLSIAPLGMR